MYSSPFLRDNSSFCTASYSNTALYTGLTCDDAEEDTEADDDEVLADVRGGSKMALGLSCHCFVGSGTTLEAAGCCFTLFLSGRGGPGEDCDGDDISDDDGVSDEGGLGGASVGLGSDAIMI